MTQIEYSADFVKDFKRLVAKYPSLEADVDALEAELQSTPETGESLGAGLRKVRMAIASKNKGKSGGARVITLHVLAIEAEALQKLVLLTMYDKSEAATIKTSDLKKLMKKNGY